MNKFPTTQEHLDIEDVRDGIVVLRNGGAALVLKTSAVNFDLLSEKEQDAMMSAYGNLLNSLSFPIQVVIRSKRMDITDYLDWVNGQIEEQKNSKLKALTGNYRKFIQDLITKNEVLDKNFYVVIPYGQTVLVGTDSPLAYFKKLFGAQEKRVRVDVDSVLERAKTNLYPKRDSLIREFKRVGIMSEQLHTEQLIQLYYDIYNPDASRAQKMKITSSDYTTPIVEPLRSGSQ